jgi:hypothetical protein
LEVPGFEPKTGQKIFFSRKSRWALGQTQPSIQCVPEFFPETERPGRDVDQSHPSSTEVMNEWSHTSTPPYVFYEGDRDNFTVPQTVNMLKIILE